MPNFQYKAKDSKGNKVTGKIYSDTRADAIDELRGKKVYPITINQIKTKKSMFEASSILKPKIKRKQLAVFFRMFASMLQAGIPLTVILDVMTKQEKNSSLKQILETIDSDIMKGNNLSNAMSRHKIFSSMITSMVEVGETNGRLEVAFDQIATNLEREENLSSKIKGAMIYPIVLLSVSILAFILISTLVFPVFIDLFVQAGAELPKMTMVILNLSEIIKTYWIIIMLVLLLLIVGFRKMMKTPTSRELIDRIILQIPVIGNLQTIIYMAKFCRAFSALFEGGLEVSASFLTVKKVIGNLYLKKNIDTIIKDIQSGSTIYEAISVHDTFPYLVVSMLRIGEESGNLAEMLKKAAEIYEKEAETYLQKMTALAEPLITVVMAVGVGILILSIVQPMFQMYTIIGR